MVAASSNGITSWRARAFNSDKLFVSVSLRGCASLYRRFWLRALALLACVGLVYLAAGGTFVHKHQKGPETACHICQAIHMPALAADTMDLVHAAAPLGWYASLPHHAAPLDSFALHRASRAPPPA